jgi:hypothetical protein
MRARNALFFASFVLAVGCASKNDAAPGGPAEDTGTSPGVDSSTPGTDASPKDDTATPGTDTAVAPDTTPPPCPDAGCDGLIAQEWGTYTSVQGTDGKTLGGVHHVDEALPAWVHRRNFTNPSDYFFEKLPEEPLQQLETPVIYFWSKKPVDVQVKVDFPRGVVGEWYPDASTYAPKIDGLTGVSNGSMTWNVSVDPTIASSTFAPVDPAEIWAPSRHVASTPLRFKTSGGATENEQFIFYRGLATYDAAIRVTSGDDGVLHVQNTSSDDVPAAFALQVVGDKAQIVPIGALLAGRELTVTPPAPTQPLTTYVAEAQRVLKDALVASGLYDDVAKAMVDTWTRSWFKNTGLRILYLAPRKWTDGWLPLSITPAPTALTRTLVGRIEVITKSEETALVASIREAAKTHATFDIPALGRFAEPRLRRAYALLSSTDDLVYAQGLVDTAHMNP